MKRLDAVHPGGTGGKGNGVHVLGASGQRNKERHGAAWRGIAWLGTRLKTGCLSAKQPARGMRSAWLESIESIECPWVSKSIRHNRNQWVQQHVYPIATA